MTESPATSAPNPVTADANEESIGELVKASLDSVSTIVRGEIELAKLELKSSVKNAGVGAGMFIAAAILLVFSLTFGFIALAEGLIAAGLYRWLGYLVVFAFFVAVAAALVFLGIKKVKAVKAPQQTIETGRDTVSYLKSRPNSAPPAAKTGT